jgi:hypothetical protein
LEGRGADAEVGLAEAVGFADFIVTVSGDRNPKFCMGATFRDVAGGAGGNGERVAETWPA